MSDVKPVLGQSYPLAELHKTACVTFQQFLHDNSKSREKNYYRLVFQIHGPSNDGVYCQENNGFVLRAADELCPDAAESTARWYFDLRRRLGPILYYLGFSSADEMLVQQETRSVGLVMPVVVEDGEERISMAAGHRRGILVQISNRSTFAFACRSSVTCSSDV